jgi:hypothetical protein
VSNLRDRVRKLAAEKPELRQHLLPMLREARTGWRDLARVMSSALADGSPQALGELSDYAVNVFREEARKLGYGPNDYEAMAREEMSRLRAYSPTEGDLAKYLKASRAGASYRFSRTMRAALFVQFVAKGIIR